jgi:hypothetical protein
MKNKEQFIREWCFIRDMPKNQRRKLLIDKLKSIKNSNK